MSPRRLPVFLDLSNRRVLIAGGGRVAERKIPALLDAEARITLVAPSLRPAIRELLRGHQLIERPACSDDVTSDYLLFFPLTDDASVNRRLTEAARAARVLTSGCSDQDDSDFFMAAVVEQGPVRIAISTEGRSPSLAKRWALRMRTLLSNNFIE